MCPTAMLNIFLDSIPVKYLDPVDLEILLVCLPDNCQDQLDHVISDGAEEEVLSVPWW